MGKAVLIRISKVTVAILEYMAGSAGRIVGRVVAALVVLVLIVGGASAYQNRQQISDFFAAQAFSPSPEMLALTERIEPTVIGERLFFASKPTLDASQRFNEQCSQVDHSEEGHVLGCFSGGRIHLFQVTDERLAGIVEVTAAHELLHAAFSRLSAEEKAALGEELRAAFDELSANDPALARRMDVYRSLSTTAFANELHSVLGTEVRALPAWLEAHYSQWFENRGVIVDFFDAYHDVFTELQARAEGLEAQLVTLRTDIEARTAQYDAAVSRFNAEWQSFLQRNEAFEFSDNPGLFYAIRDDFDARRTQLNADLEALNADISRYETMRVELQQLGELNSELQDQLNSDLAPPAELPNN